MVQFYCWVSHLERRDILVKRRFKDFVNQENIPALWRDAPLQALYVVYSPVSDKQLWWFFNLFWLEINTGKKFVRDGELPIYRWKHSWCYTPRCKSFETDGKKFSWEGKTLSLRFPASYLRHVCACTTNLFFIDTCIPKVLRHKNSYSFKE